jgi:hypothetical protein
MSSTNTYIITEQQRLNFKPTYLYIKQHELTNLKYFGKTIQDPYKYTGSGGYWKSHIKIHGKKHIKTIWYQLFDNIDELVSFALEFSVKNNIVESNAWANLKPENGLDGALSGENNHNYNKPQSYESNQKRSNKLKGRIRTKEELLKQSNSTKGRKESKEAIEKRSIIRSYNWKIIDPNGIEYYSSRLKIFCEQYKLKYTSAIYSAKRNIPSIKGPNKGWVFILFGKK